MRDNLFVRTFKNRFVPIVLVTFLFAIAMICYDVMWMRPVYSVDSKVVVSAKSGNTSTTQIETVKYLVKSRMVLTEVKQNLKLKPNVEDLSKKISISDENSKIVSINVEDTVIQRARDIADELADITVKNATDEYKVEVLEYSSAPLKAVSPNLVRDTLLALLIGFLISFIICMVRESHDDVMRVNTDVEDLGVNVIGDIPYVDERGAMIDEG
ncbi:Wzz/FepE/Etk N-terminal domain-containing protein [Finegoldia magna]|uniref:YveK family protein n=1 Tax=Finegoldia magna TaxID=1260 RepID=UPI0032C0F841